MLKAKYSDNKFEMLVTNSTVFCHHYPKIVTSTYKEQTRYNRHQPNVVLASQ